MKSGAFESEEDIWAPRLWTRSRGQRRVLAPKAARPFCRVHEGHAVPEHILPWGFWLCTLVPLLLLRCWRGNPRSRLCIVPSAGKAVAPARLQEDAGLLWQMLRRRVMLGGGSSRPGLVTAPFTCHRSPLPPHAQLFTPECGSSPLHAATVPNLTGSDFLLLYPQDYLS